MRGFWAHIVLAAIWFITVIPTLLWWKNSVLWVGFCSVYANFGWHVVAALEYRKAQANR
jgi:hypothetical protein